MWQCKSVSGFESWRRRCLDDCFVDDASVVIQASCQREIERYLTKETQYLAHPPRSSLTRSETSYALRRVKRSFMSASPFFAFSFAMSASSATSWSRRLGPPGYVYA